MKLIQNQSYLYVIDSVENLLILRHKDCEKNFNILPSDALIGRFIIWPPDGSVPHPFATMVDVCSLVTAKDGEKNVSEISPL